MAVKKVVVAIGHGSRDIVVLKGNDLEVINKSSPEGELIVKEKKPKNAGEETLGVFKVWSYWKAIQVDDKKEKPEDYSGSSIRKLIVKPKRPLTSAQWRNIFQQVTSPSKLAAIPHDCSVIVLYKNGEVKII